ncbi:proteasome regulatory non-ATPase subunit [Trypanosoma rangeli]|uniref:Proteasome regulatory non-ATPase subunit n=1 Tax=Trypanosoma rangeli TaxID=5698 RepID=A0A3R7NGB6_TRYRA|nr:proteasome regulatory non-ATPase subunit [Trypanosoma rangeli]RNF02292.1 proteasome regulatory non-ATPase subunit [Trypanosoma rangeli]|eukprot:RNF02292.1 proteasome regulatory non-ATPase subunit [Trypanosoma rangeli]
MPEACFLCLDSTEFMRNGDQFPTRFLGVQEAASLLSNAKIQMNAENTVGFLTLGGNACTVFETLTLDVERVMCSLANISIRGKQCHFSQGLQIASLALSHRTNPRAEKRIVAFIGTPLSETDEELDKLARKLRKDDVAVDIVGICVEENVSRLAAFVDKLSKNGNSRFLNIPVGANLTDALMTSPILLGADSVGGATDSHEAYQGFGVDPSNDPDLAMAIRMSLEEEQQRQAAAATLASQNTAPAAATTHEEPSPPHEEPEDLENLSEEEMIARAMRMSLEDAQQTGKGAEARNTVATSDEGSFMHELERRLEGERLNKGTSQPPGDDNLPVNEEESQGEEEPKDKK